MSDRKMKRLDSKKSHSWWWDSHVSPKNNKWLSENLEEMDRSVKRMLKLIEEEGDSFAKKAEMYYQKRPQLISHVEQFYRMYRSLAERYDHLTGELRKNIPSDLESQGSGISDCISEAATPVTLDRRPSRRRSSGRAAGFDFFLGSGGASSDLSRKESDDSSSSSSDSESKSEGASSKNNDFGPSVNGDGEGMRLRIIELEVELRELKEKLRVAEEENSDALSRASGIGNYEELIGRITWYEEELKVANERLRLSEEEILRLKHKLENTESSEGTHNLEAQLESAHKEITVHMNEVKVREKQVLELQERIAGLEANLKDEHDNIEAFEKELRITKQKLEASNEEIGRLTVELERSSSPADFKIWDVAFESGNGKIADLDTSVLNQDSKIRAMEEDLRISNDKLQLSVEEIAKLKHELENSKTSITTTTTDLQQQLESARKEIEKKEAELESEKSLIVEQHDQIMRLESDISNRDQEIGQLKSAVFDAHQDFSLEKSQLEKVVSGLTESVTNLELKLNEWESRGRSLEDEIKSINAEKTKMQALHDSRERGIQVEIERLKSDIEDRNKRVEELNRSFDALKLKYDTLMANRDGLNAKVLNLMATLGSKDDQIHQMDGHLHKLHLEHVELISGCEVARKLAEELQFKVKELEEEVERQRAVISDGNENKREALQLRLKELEEEVERQRVVISDGAEKKREAIRQLCFSLEHYRNGYHQLRLAFQGHRRPAVLAS